MRKRCTGHSTHAWTSHGMSDDEYGMMDRDAMTELARLGAHFDAKATKTRVFVYIYSAAPKLVDSSDPTVHADECKFYKSFSNSNTTKWHELIEALAFPGENKFVYSYNKYYLLSMEIPYVWYHHLDWPLPGGDTKAAESRAIDALEMEMNK